MRPTQKENPKATTATRHFQGVRFAVLAFLGGHGRHGIQRTLAKLDRLAAQHRFFSCDPERTAREANPSHERRLSVTPPVHSRNGGSIQALCGLLGQGTLKQPELVMIKFQCSIYADNVIL